jgi:hypothetical protein
MVTRVSAMTILLPQADEAEVVQVVANIVRLYFRLVVKAMDRSLSSC